MIIAAFIVVIVITVLIFSLYYTSFQTIFLVFSISPVHDKSLKFN
jgi:hypothetical protein